MGELLYARVRILAGLFSVAYLFVFAPLSIVLLAAYFYSRGMTFGLLIALLLSNFLLGSYGRILQRYRYTRNGDAQQG